jgi:hypothetical protein
MGKGKKNTMKNESKVGEQEAGASRKKQKVSSEDNTNDAPLNSTCIPTTDPADEKWDVVRVLEDPSACDCRTPECESKAVVVWATTLDPTDEWPMCEKCQETDFGGWPDNFTPPKHVQSNVHNEDAATPDPKETQGKEPDEVATEDQTEETAEDTPTADESCNAKECDPSKVSESNGTSKDSGIIDEDQADGEEEEMEEVWDVKKVMSIADVKDCPTECSNETCTLAAACVYVSNLAPTEDWNTCLDCQVSNCDERIIGGCPALSYFTRLLTSICFNVTGKRLRRMARNPRTSDRFHDAGTQRRSDLQVFSQEGRSHARLCGCGGR